MWVPFFGHAMPLPFPNFGYVATPLPHHTETYTRLPLVQQKQYIGGILRLLRKPYFNVEPMIVLFML